MFKNFYLLRDPPGVKPSEFDLDGLELESIAIVNQGGQNLGSA